MKKFLLIICTLLFIIPLFARDVGNTSDCEYRYKVVSKKALKVMSEPSSKSKVLFKVEPGDYIYGNEINENWILISGDQWYISTASLQKEKNELYVVEEVVEEPVENAATKIQRIVRYCLLGACIIFFIIFLIACWDVLVDLFEESVVGKYYIAEDGKGYHMNRKFYYGITSYIGVMGIVLIIVASIVAGIISVLVVGGTVWLLLAILWLLMKILIIAGWISLVGGILAFLGEKGCTTAIIAIIGGVIVTASDAISELGEIMLEAGFSFFNHLNILQFSLDMVITYWKPALMIASVPLVLFLGLIFITMLVSGIFMLTEYIVMRRYNIKNPCPVCQHASEPAIYLEQGYELPVPLRPGKYGLFSLRHPITKKKMPTMLFNGKDKLERKCKHCGNIISAEMGTEKHIALAGVAESGKTTLVYRIIAELMSKHPNSIAFTDVLQSDYIMMEDIKDIVKNGYMDNFPQKTEVGQRRAIQLKISRGSNMFYRLYINDVGGELYALNAMNAANSNITAQFVRNVESILFLVDPMTIDFSDCDISDEFKLWLEKNQSDNERINIFDAFSRLREFFTSHNISQKDISRINFNIVLVKSDLGYLKNIDSSNPDALQEFMRADMGMDRLISDVYNFFKADKINYISFSAIAKTEESGNTGKLANMLLQQLNIEVSQTPLPYSYNKFTTPKPATEEVFVQPAAIEQNIVTSEPSPVVEIENNETVNDGEPLYDVLLTDCGVAKLAVVKIVKELTGLGLKEAKDLTDNIPSVIAEGISEDKAYMLAASLEDSGATASVREHKK